MDTSWAKSTTTPKRIKAKQAKGRTTRKKEGRNIFKRSFGRKTKGRKYNFKPAVLMHFHSAADNWWKNEKIEGVAALYELARRHPRVGQLRLSFKRSSWYGQELRSPLVGAAKKRMATKALDDLGQEPGAVHCLCLIGLKSWPKLVWRDQEFWEMSAGKMKGLDCRDGLTVCHSIGLLARSHILVKRAVALKLRARAPHENSLDFLAKHLQQNPISSAEWEAAIARASVSAHREGRLLISVAPDLTLEDAKILLEREYREHLELAPAVRQRARWEDWLPLIAAFENEEAQLGGKKSQVFVRYRRAVDSILFAPRVDVSVTTTLPN